MNTIKLTAVIAIASALVVGCAPAFGNTTKGAYSSPTYNTEQVEASIPTCSEGTCGDGLYEVGSEIQPGTYKTAGADPSSIWPMCYYARRRNLSGELNSIIVNNNFKGPSTVTVQPTDKAVELSGGCVWKKVR